MIDLNLKYSVRRKPKYLPIAMLVGMSSRFSSGHTRIKFWNDTDERMINPIIPRPRFVMVIITVSYSFRSIWRAMILSDRRISRSTGKMDICLTTSRPAWELARRARNTRKEMLNIERDILGMCMIRILFSMILVSADPITMVERRMAPATIPVESRVMDSATGTIMPRVGSPIMCLENATIVAIQGSNKIRMTVFAGTPVFTAY